MCGIAGIVHLDGAPVARERVRVMADTLVHRGPDGSGALALGAAALAHTRRSIIDLGGGGQPMSNEDGTVWVTFNGEIFNYVELREELLAKGHTLATRSDTEVLVHLYEEHGPDFVAKLNGQWGFAIWDQRNQRLVLSRDRLGIRPVYYTRHGQELFFASEVKALFATGEVPRALDPLGLDQVFTFWATIPGRTVFEGVSELPPGHTLVVDKGEIGTPKRYWSLDFTASRPGGTTEREEDAYAEELRALLIDSARLQLRADVPVGAYLSGGLDSSVVCAIVKRFTDTPLETFSLAFEDPEFDESSFQVKVKEHLGIEKHHEVRCTADEIGRVFPDVVKYAEQPILRTAPAPMFVLSRLVKEHSFKVVLTGEGSDELLGGYDLFKEAKVRRFCARQPTSAQRPRLLRKLYPYLPGLQRQTDAYLRQFFMARPEDLDDAFFSHRPRWTSTAKMKLFLRRELKERTKGLDTADAVRARLPANFSQWEPLAQAQWLEATILMPGYLLSAQGDRMGMANAVEARFPFLDHRIAELAVRVPAHLRTKVLDEKHLLKRATMDLLPSFLKRRPKQPYRAMDAASFFDAAAHKARFGWVDEILSEREVERVGVFDSKAVSLLVKKAKAGPLTANTDAMALVGIVSTQLLGAQLVNRMEVGS